MSAFPLLADRHGFTLVEVLVTLTIFGLLTIMLFTSFHAITRSWEVGRETIDNTNHADYILDQLVAALRSAYHPGDQSQAYGFTLVDQGDDEDIIEWTKTGPTLVGEDAEFAAVPHRVRVSANSDDGFTVRAWRQDLNADDDFDPLNDETVGEIHLSPRVVGLNCRVLDPDQEKTLADELNWIDEWTATNEIPSTLELTLFLKPAEDGDSPTEAKRIVEIPLAALSQNPSLGSTTTQSSRSAGQTPSGGASSATPSAPPAGMAPVPAGP